MENAINIPNSIETDNMTQDNDRLSSLSYSSFDSIDNRKTSIMGQLTCDECSEIPRILDIDVNTKSISFRCRNHGFKQKPIKDYVFNSLNYNPLNWKCSNCPHTQKETPADKFIFCLCGSVFCPNCYSVHKKEHKDEIYIESDVYSIKCREKPEHFKNSYKGYCYDCAKNYCELCEEAHKYHRKVENNTFEIDQVKIDNIRELNKKYRSFITYYESLIRLNNFIIYSYEHYRQNYNNLYNINTMLTYYKRNSFFISKPESIGEESTTEVNKNFNDYISNLYLGNQPLKEEDTKEIKIYNKFFNNNDLKILTKLELKNLKILELDYNSITNIDCLQNANFPELVILSLKNNEITDISALKDAKFRELQGLLLSNNNIKDIKPIGEFQKLRLIDLRNNQIEDIVIFGSEKFDLLQCVYLSGNKFDLTKFNAVKEKLDKCEEHLY
jgi:hypothetical protein